MEADKEDKGKGIMVESQDHPVIPALRALIMDNDDNTRLIHQNLLERLGVETHTVKNGQEGLDLIDWGAKQFELILMDRQMPVMDGIKATKVLRTIRYPSLILGVSERRLTEVEWEEFFKAGLDDIRDEGKPLSLDELKVIVESVPTREERDKRNNRLNKGSSSATQ